MRRPFRFLTITLLSLIAVGASSRPASALTMTIDNAFNGPAPDGDAPWATITLTDDGAGTVTLAVDGSLSGDDFLSNLYLNLDPSYDAADLADVEFAYVSGVEADSIAIGIDDYQADGDGLYDVLIDFANDAAGRFDGADSVIYMITCSACSGFGASSFEFLSAPNGGTGPFFAAGHIQSTGAKGEDSTWVAADDATGGPGLPVPEPGSLVLLGSAIFASALRWRKRASSVE